MIPACDISQWQGAIDWSTMPPIALIKMSGGDNGLYMDSKASVNYGGAVASGKAVGGYHFIGWTLGAVQEASYFLQAMSPLAENDVYALDIEAIPAGVNPVPYVQEMVDFIHSKINVYPLVYMNVSTLKAHDWSNVLKTCGLWLADWNNDPAGTIPNVPIYVMQQYSDGPVYDHDEWFGTIDEFKACGYHKPVAVPSPAPTPVVTPTPVVVENPPTPTQQGSGNPVATTTPIQTVPEPTKTNITTKPSSVGNASTLGSIIPLHTGTQVGFWARLLNWFLRLIGVK